MNVNERGPQMRSITLNVEGMRCEGCVERVRSAIAGQPGVRAADVSLEPSSARILYDPRQTDEDQLVEVVQKLGYLVVDRASP